MIARRGLLAALGALGLEHASCGGVRAAPGTGVAAPTPAAAFPPLRIEPLVDLAPAVDLVWLLHARPSAWRDRSAWVEAADPAMPATILDALKSDGAGVDWRQAAEVVVAGFSDATLVLVRTPFEPARLERAFARRALEVEGRAVERGVTRLWGTVDGVRTQVALFGHDAIAVERGRFGPLQIAAYFAEGRLKRSPPALRAPPLAELAARLGRPEAPLRFFAPGPFDGPWAEGLGGLLRAATAAGVCLVPVDRSADAVDARMTLMGAWGDTWPRAAERLGAFFRVTTEDSLARLMGLDRPVADPSATGDAGAIALDVRLDGAALARGLRAATTATLAEILGKPGASTVSH